MGSAGNEVRSIASEIRGSCAVLKTLHQRLPQVVASRYYAHCQDLIDDMMSASQEMYSDILRITKGFQRLTMTTEEKPNIRPRVCVATFYKPRVLSSKPILRIFA